MVGHHWHPSSDGGPRRLPPLNDPTLPVEQAQLLGKRLRRQGLSYSSSTTRTVALRSCRRNARRTMGALLIA